MEIIQTILATVVTLGVLVSVHEFGHFWVARRCGIKVLRFSIGFGQPLFKWSDSSGTEYVIALIPLGGYVKMLDEREGEVAPDDLDFAFNRQSVGKRIAVVIAGPAANFLFAILAYWWVFVSGVTTVVPVIGVVQPGSLADQAGLMPGYEIRAVDTVQTATWQAINIQLFHHMGETGSVSINARPFEGGIEKIYPIRLHEWMMGEEQPDPLVSLGIEPYRPVIPARLGAVMPEEAAAQAGLVEDDLIVAVQGIAIDDWQGLVQVIRAHPQQEIELEIERQGRLFTQMVTPGQRMAQDRVPIGYLGVAAKNVAWPDAMQREISYPIYAAWVPALEKTWDMTVLTLVSLKKMLVGLISIKNLSGPITIAKVAGASADRGAETFLNFLAYISISLGLINIMPIPVLDGGHLLYYFAELVRGKPVPEKIQLVGQKIGLAIIAALMFLAIYNDLVRL